jgi:hypothetical protein
MEHHWISAQEANQPYKDTWEEELMRVVRNICHSNYSQMYDDVFCNQNQQDIIILDSITWALK